MSNLDSVLKSRDVTLLTTLCVVKAMAFPTVMFGWAGPWELDHESWTLKGFMVFYGLSLKNWCLRPVVLEKTLESPLDSKKIKQSVLKEIPLNIYWKDWCWSWSSNTLATSCEELTHWKRPWCWEKLKARGEGGDGGWDGWMASLTQWTWV